MFISVRLAAARLAHDRDVLAAVDASVVIPRSACTAMSPIEYVLVTASSSMTGDAGGGHPPPNRPPPPKPPPARRSRRAPPLRPRRRSRCVAPPSVPGARTRARRGRRARRRQRLGDDHLLAGAQSLDDLRPAVAADADDHLPSASSCRCALRSTVAVLLVPGTALLGNVTPDACWSITATDAVMPGFTWALRWVKRQRRVVADDAVAGRPDRRDRAHLRGQLDAGERIEGDGRGLSDLELGDVGLVERDRDGHLGGC